MSNERNNYIIFVQHPLTGPLDLRFGRSHDNSISFRKKPTSI